MPEPELRDGEWLLPERPGLGVDLNEETVRQSLAAPVTTIS